MPLSLEQIYAVFHSLRFRLSAWNTLAVLVIVIVTLVSVREALRLTLWSENDKLLLDDAHEVELAIEGFYPDMHQIVSEMNRKAIGHLDRKLFVQLLDERGVVIATSGEPPRLDQMPFAADEASWSTIAGNRVVQRTIAFMGLPVWTVRVGASLANVQSDLAIATRLMTVAGIVILFVAPLSGYWLAGRATRPLAHIIATASRLRPRHMDERMPVAATEGEGDELDQLSRTINHFLDLLRDYLERNREFVANAAHELRSPLAAVQSSVEVALNSDRTIGEYQELLVEIAGECQQLGVLVNQLLLLAETDGSASPLEPNRVRLDQLIERSLDMFRGAAEERGIVLSADLRDQIVIASDGDRLRQVINNLIDNSLKFTPRGGQVLVSLRYERLANQAVMRVADTGAGISAEDLEHVFERFYRGDKSRQRELPTSGNGLGLSICESIVHAHGGTILAESLPGGGASFTVTLPLTETVQEQQRFARETVQS